MTRMKLPRGFPTPATCAEEVTQWQDMPGTDQDTKKLNYRLHVRGLFRWPKTRINAQGLKINNSFSPLRKRNPLQ